MDPARQLAHLSLSVAVGVLTRTLDVVRLVDGLLVSTAQSNASDARAAGEAWPAEESADLTSAASALRARAWTDAPAGRPAARKVAAKKTAATTPATKKAGTTTSPAKRSSAKKPAAKKTTTKKPTTKKPATKRTATKKTAATKPTPKAAAKKSTS